ncbi:uncharacterized protein EV420DRAFT_1724792 [Desarmillaria tabescens]|uniref:Uncharacterized protein n=1 Tax=Armillaria tabescens TaxID=1929756 RepID=A0AA39NF40_ARMTA|nr:uncharacterized protein EV420DRAFT_1724792 [Desarmillaria tabescens]KAK0464303.1 hypothetical protein EV420DRAFT_1724792 [Desarmillaria tabescens]
MGILDDQVPFTVTVTSKIHTLFEEAKTPKVEHEHNAAWVIHYCIHTIVSEVLNALDNTLSVDRRTPSRDFPSFGYVDFITHQGTDNELNELQRPQVYEPGAQQDPKAIAAEDVGLIRSQVTRTALCCCPRTPICMGDDNPYPYDVSNEGGVRMAVLTSLLLPGVTVDAPAPLPALRNPVGLTHLSTSSNGSDVTNISHHDALSESGRQTLSAIILEDLRLLA